MKRSPSFEFPIAGITERPRAGSIIAEVAGRYRETQNVDDNLKLPRAITGKLSLHLRGREEACSWPISNSTRKSTSLLGLAVPFSTEPNNTGPEYVAGHRIAPAQWRQASGLQSSRRPQFYHCPSEHIPQHDRPFVHNFSSTLTIPERARMRKAGFEPRNDPPGH